MLDSLKQNGGIIMICFLPELVKSVHGNEATISDVVDHIIYAGQRIGYEHVGIGSDFDGMLKGPTALDEVSDYPKLIGMLLDRGVSEEAVKQVAGLNILRVLQAVEYASVRLRNEPGNRLLPASDDSIVSTWSVQERNMLVDEGARRRMRRDLTLEAENAGT